VTTGLQPMGHPGSGGGVAKTRQMRLSPGVNPVSRRQFEPFSAHGSSEIGKAQGRVRDPTRQGCPTKAQPDRIGDATRRSARGAFVQLGPRPAVVRVPQVDQNQSGANAASSARKCSLASELLHEAIIDPKICGHRQPNFSSSVRTGEGEARACGSFAARLVQPTRATIGLSCCARMLLATPLHHLIQR